MLRACFLAYISSAYLLLSYPALAKNDTINIEPQKASPDAIVIDGDKLELHLDRKMRALGNAAIHRDKQDIYGDTIDYDIQNDELEVTGNARIELGDATLKGPKLRMRLTENIGEMRDASIQTKPNKNTPMSGGNSSATLTKKLGSLENQYPENIAPLNSDQANTTKLSTMPTSTVRGDAKAIFFEGQDKKRLVGARYTTCAADVDDWYIKASEIKLNNYTDSGTASNAHVEFKGIPLLYSPWMSFSFNNQRKSGLLSPTIGSTSKSGFEVHVPYYWNISPNMDATLAARELSKRGVQLQGEFRYLEESFSGTDNVEYLSKDSLTNSTRYYANLKHQHNLENGWSAGYNLEKVSDNQYFSELSTHIVTTSRVNLPQQLYVNYGSGNADHDWGLNALVQKFQTLNSSYPYELMPALTFNSNHYFNNLNAHVYAQSATFDINNDDPIRNRVTGTRLTAYPTISLPLTRSFGYITPKLGIHHTSYSLNDDPFNQSSQQRTLPIFSLNSGLYFDRQFDVAGRPYLQTIEPRLFYVYIPSKDQSKLPVFDSGESDLNFSSLFSENQFTSNDRINNANQVSFAVTTRFIESSSGMDRLSASIGQRYYFADQEVTLPGGSTRKNNSSDIIAGVSGHLKNSWVINALWQYNTDESGSVRSTLVARYNPEPGKALNLGYSYRQDLIDQIDISGQWPLGKGWYGVGRVNYTFRENGLIESLAGLEYDAGCWQARSVIQRVSTATADANYALFFQLELGGLASIGANPLKIIKRNIPGYTSSGLIPDTYQQRHYE